MLPCYDLSKTFIEEILSVTTRADKPTPWIVIPADPGRLEQITAAPRRPSIKK
jgi:hypothetical protein